ncbi:MAG TPA: Heimdall-CTERM domain-containing surface protein [Candidatus Deferrimicrobium sp.]|nr:Heimdall-CTERM domain-containing surface protein [Candidatus Deferrimicrobium sp.]
MVPVDTSTSGTWTYLIEFKDSAGNFGVNDTVDITITPPPIPGFEFIATLLGLLALMGIALGLKRKQLEIP